jgi:hypothetical protein
MVVSDKDKNQLFDLNADPLEYANLYYSGQHPDVITRLSAKLTAWQKKNGDDLVLQF